MEEKSKSRKPTYPPKWWTMVIGDIEKAVANAKADFNTPGTVIGFEDPNGPDGGITSIFVRLDNGEVGQYPIKEGAISPLIGSVLKGNLPEPEAIIQEPQLAAYIFEVIRSRINLIPALWLRKIVQKMVTNKPITLKEDLKPFPEWVKLSAEKRQDKVLIDLLYRATQYEGLKGLLRYNDII